MSVNVIARARKRKKQYLRKGLKNTMLWGFLLGLSIHVQALVLTCIAGLMLTLSVFVLVAGLFPLVYFVKEELRNLR